MSNNWNKLTPDIFSHIASFLSNNDVTCSLRCINKATAQQFAAVLTIRLSEPSPPSIFAAHWRRPEAVHGLTLRQRRKLVVLTARSGSIANMLVGLSAAGCTLTTEIFSAAAAVGQLAMCQWLVVKGCPRDRCDAARAAAHGGHLAVLRWLLQQQHPQKTDSYPFHLHNICWEAAAAAGQRYVCEALAAEGFLCKYWAGPVAAAARGGHVDLTLWLLDQRLRRGHLRLIEHLTKDNIEDFIAAAAYGFPLSSLQQLVSLLQQQQELQQIWPAANTSSSSVSSSGSSSLAKESFGAIACARFSPTSDWAEKLEWLRTQGCEDMMELPPPVAAGGGLHGNMSLERAQSVLPRPRPDDSTVVAAFLQSAVMCPSPPLLRFLCRDRRHLPRLFPAACLQAAEAGSVEMIAELALLGWQLEGPALEAAARGGHLRLLQWVERTQAADLQALLGPELAAAAAESGSLEVMSWLQSRGCEWDERAFAAAAKAGNVALLEWLAAQGCQMGASGDPYLAAGSNGDLTTLRWLRGAGCPWGDPTGGIFARGMLSTPPEVLQWLYGGGSPGACTAGG